MILLAALFCWCALQGTLELNPQGIGMDSDLQNYAQIMEAAEYPAAFALDPVASYFPRDPGVPNLLTDLAGLFPGGDNAAVDMLRVGSSPITSWGVACSAVRLWRSCSRS